VKKKKRNSCRRTEGGTKGNGSLVRSNFTKRRVPRVQSWARASQRKKRLILRFLPGDWSVIKEETGDEIKNKKREYKTGETYAKEDEPKMRGIYTGL